MRILSISSQVAYGPVGNTAAVPAMQALGHEVIALPTILLSSHPGHGQPQALRVPAPDLAAMLGVLEQMGVLDSCGAVLTGYFASNDQIHGVARMVRRMRERKPELYVLVDPVIGDNDAIYVPPPVAEAVRDVLLPLASAITPNRFELEWLTGWRAGSLKEAESAAKQLAIAEVIATSIPASADQLATICVTEASTSPYFSPWRPQVPHGTGDFLAGLYLARRASGNAPAIALAGAMDVLERAIARDAGSEVLAIASALYGP